MAGLSGTVRRLQGHLSRSLLEEIRKQTNGRYLCLELVFNINLAKYNLTKSKIVWPFSDSPDSHGVC